MPSHVDLTQALIVLERFSRAMTQAATEALGLPGNVEIQVLLLIHYQPGVTPGGIAATTEFRNSTVSRALSRLEQDGLVVRVPASFDARSSTVRLTRKGRGRVARFERSLAAVIAEHRGDLISAWGLVSADSRPSHVPANSLDAAMALTRVGAAYMLEVGEALKPFDVADTAGRFALTLISSNEGIRPSQLGHALGLSTSGTSDLLDRLDVAGLIERNHDDPMDRRVVTVRLTALGKRARAAKLKAFAQHADAIATAVSLTLQSTVADGVATA